MNMFKPSPAKTRKEYLDLIEDPARKKALMTLDKLIRKIAPQHKPHIMAGMLAYGKFKYRYGTGREGEWFPIGIANRKAYMTLIICVVDPKNRKYLTEGYKKELGKVTVGRSCVGFKKLEDLNLDAVERLVKVAAKSDNLYSL